MSARRYTALWSEDARLDDGTNVHLRAVSADDKPRFREAFSRLSRPSRYQRFFAEKDALSDADLRYLTELDGEQHFAIGALDEHGMGLGVARFIRLPAEPTVAEAAVTVVDDRQGCGLGRLLCTRLAAAAHERGVLRFRCEVLAANDKMQSLLRSLSVDAAVTAPDEGVVTIELPIGEAAVAAVPQDDGPLYRLLALAAEGLIVVHRAFDWLGASEPPKPLDPDPHDPEGDET